ncbi:hypothetical protein CEXT_407171 [Caerostris extrusa]|uniref:Uncharacterized protein n=1 Tax=Caerostris extrusa TaxID=172846 RepID=A0AAV4UPF2_CAEEX|nr:hypothetical protein CEXT_407171 [Caerostris extrusa]
MTFNIMGKLLLDIINKILQLPILNPFEQDGGYHNRITCLAGASASRVETPSITMVTAPRGHSDDRSHLSEGNEHARADLQWCVQ